jgi:hypothetical protein
MEPSGIRGAFLDLDLRAAGSPTAASDAIAPLAMAAGPFSRKSRRE